MRTILIADDEPAIRTINRRSLERAGYTKENDFRYAETDTGSGAWEKYLAEKPALIILDDIMVDSVRGSEVARRIRQGYGDSIPDSIVHIISASATGEFKDLPHAVDLLRKPYCPQELVDLAKKHLGDPISEQKTQKSA